MQLFGDMYLVYYLKQSNGLSNSFVDDMFIRVDGIALKL